MEQQEKTILVVDDEPAIRELVCEYFRNLNRYEILSAPNGLKALETISNTSVDVVISDINMPEMKGFDLLKEVKERYPRIKRILMTAYNVEDYLELALQYDIGNIFVKTIPFNFNELSVTVEKLLRNDIFGLHHYFAEPITSAHYSVTTSRQLDKDTASIISFIDHKGEIHRLELVLVELLTNALFYGVRNEPPDQKEDWNHDFTLPESEAVRVTVAKDPEKYGISICDTGGRLKKRDVLYWLNRQTSRGQNGLPLGLFDTHGRGLFITRKYIDRFIVNIDQKRKTEIVVLNYYSDTHKGEFKPLCIYEL